MSMSTQQLVSSAGLFLSGLFILLVTFQTLHGNVVAQELSPALHDRSNFSVGAWIDPELPTSPIYVAGRGQERLEMLLLTKDKKPGECLHRSLERLETAKHSWQAGFYEPTMVTLHKGFGYLHEATHTWQGEDYTGFTPVADAYMETLDEMIANGFSDVQKAELRGLREHVQILREQFHF